MRRQEKLSFFFDHVFNAVLIDIYEDLLVRAS